MENNIKKFEEYTQDPLMDDLVEISVEDDENFDPKEWEIDKIIDIMDEDPTKSEENRISNSLKEIDEAITFDTQIPSDIKRGSFFWVTALVKKKGNTSYNDPGKFAVIKCKVIDLFFGMSHLNKVINR